MIGDRDFDLSKRDIFSDVNNPLSSLLSPLLPGQQTTSDSSSTITLSTGTTATPTQNSSTSTATSASSSSTVTPTQTSSPSSSNDSSSSVASPTSPSISPSTSAVASTAISDAFSSTSPTSATETGAGGTVTATSTSPSATASTTAAANAAAPKGFLQNKSLSVGVITACSLVGFVLLVVLATWTIRRRRRNKLHDDVDFPPFPSSEELLGKHHDAERGGGGGGGDSGANAIGNSRPGSNGSANANNDNIPSTSPQNVIKARLATASPEMYQAGYPATQAFVSSSGPALAQRATTVSQQTAFPTQTYSNSAAGYNDLSPYPYYNTRAQEPTLNAYQPSAPLPAGPSYPGAYGANAATVTLAPMAPPMRKTSQRKRVPPLNLNVAQANASPPAYQANPVSGNTASPLLVGPHGITSNLTEPPLSAVSPLRPKRGSTSLLNSPVQIAYVDGPSDTEAEMRDKGGKSKNRASSHARLLDPGMPNMPVAAPLPDEFGAQSDMAVRDEKAPIRQFTVRNE